jgi:hypothetical protein
MSAHTILAHAEIEAVTVFGGTGVTVALWGLHVSDVGVIFSAAASVIAVGIQYWVAREKVKALRRLSREVDDPTDG